MSITFESNEFKDAVIFSGVDVKLEDQLADSPLIGEAQQQAFEDLEKSYKDHKEKIHFKYGRFLHIVEDNISSLKNPSLPSKIRLAVAHKLNELAEQRLQKEAKYSFVHTFFHKIGQLFQGHGFRTAGEWGKRMAGQIEKADVDMYKAQLTHWMKGGINGQLEPEAVTTLMQKINALPEGQFKAILNKTIFNQKEDSLFGKKNKHTFYEKLSAPKQAIFMQELLSKGDWFAQANDIVQGSDMKDIESFISPQLIQKFQVNAQALIDDARKMNQARDLFSALFWGAIKAHLAKGEFLQIAQMLTTQNKLKLELSNDQLKMALTPEEMEKLSKNVQLGILS